MRRRYLEAFVSALVLVVKVVLGLVVLAVLTGILTGPARPPAESVAGASGGPDGLVRDQDGTVRINAGAPGIHGVRRVIVEDANGRQMLQLTYLGVQWMEATGGRHPGNVVRLAISSDNRFCFAVLNASTWTRVESPRGGPIQVTVHKSGAQGPLLHRIDIPAGD